MALNSSTPSLLKGFVVRALASLPDPPFNNLVGRTFHKKIISLSISKSSTLFDHQMFHSFMSRLSIKIFGVDYTFSFLTEMMGKCNEMQLDTRPKAKPNDFHEFSKLT